MSTFHAVLLVVGTVCTVLCVAIACVPGRYRGTRMACAVAAVAGLGLNVTSAVVR
jgi:hypothetical protein